MTGKIAEIRARHESPGGLLPMEALGHSIADRAALLAEVERQARHIEELREKIDAERSCACSFDSPGDVCAAHSPALTRALAEVERLRQTTVLHSEVLSSHRGSPGREWHSAGAWLYPGDTIHVVRAPLFDSRVVP